MLEARDLTRRYGDFTAVRDVSFTIQDGEIVGMLGPNGAGKTTTIRMVTGFLPPHEGEVRVAGVDLVEEPRKARREIGYLPENVALYPELRVDEYLAFRARVEGLSRSEGRRAIGDIVERCLIQEVEHQVIGTLSKGFRQRVGLAGAILHQPRVLVLDEPTVGLDPKQIIAIRELIRELGRGHTLLLSTHILPEVELLCDRVLIIDRGRLVDQGSPRALRERWQGNARLHIAFKDDPSEAGEVLESLSGAVAVARDEARPERWTLEAEGDADLREPVFRLAVERGWVLLELAEEKVSLEDVFVRLTTLDVAVDESPPPEAPPPSPRGAPPDGPDEEEEVQS
jgi:ABC-2 type transport system ATP-binding protein